MKINGEVLNREQFNHCIKILWITNQEHKEISCEELIQLSSDEECFEILPSHSKEWPIVIHNCEIDGLFHFKDKKFKANHYMSKEAFANAVLAFDGTKCESCHLYYRNIQNLCELCKKINSNNS